MKLKTYSKTARFDQQGFTLIELLIAMVIGLIIVSAVLGMFVSMIKSDTDNIKAIQLNQELRTTMSLITRDIRRAGANRNSALNSTNNPFSIAGGTRLNIASNQQGTANSCITYSYDSNETNELYGFRLDAVDHTVETRASGSACNAGNWLDLTDMNLANVTALNFADTTVTEAGVNIRQITVTLTGVLVRDNSVARTITETVKIRNDEI